MQQIVTVRREFRHPAAQVSKPIQVKMVGRLHPPPAAQVNKPRANDETHPSSGKQTNPGENGRVPVPLSSGTGQQAT